MEEFFEGNCIRGYHVYKEVREAASLVPRPSAPRSFGKLEREKWKEGLVNGLTTPCSSAGMLAELIKTQISKLIAYLWKLRNGEVQCTSYRVFFVDRLGYESLKPEQETVVREFLGGKNVLHLAYGLRQIVGLER